MDDQAAGDRRCQINGNRVDLGFQSDFFLDPIRGSHDFLQQPLDVLGKSYLVEIHRTIEMFMREGDRFDPLLGTFQDGNTAFVFDVLLLKIQDVVDQVQVVDEAVVDLP